MTEFPVLVLMAWIPCCAGLFALLRPVRACTLAFIIGWLVLPMAALPIPGIPDLGKVSATSVGVVLGTVLFRTNQFRGYRVGWGEVWIVFFASSTFYTSVANDLGPYDGLSSLLDKLLWYAVPYVFGRVYIRTREEFLEASRIVVGAAAIYAMLALYEWKMSPQLHRIVYGFFQHSWLLNARWGAYRPLVCFPSNLALAGFFCWTALLAVFLYRAGRLRTMWSMPAAFQLGAPIIGLLTSMSIGPWGLFGAGAATVYAWQRSGRRVLIMIAPLFALTWMTVRYTDGSDGKWLTDIVAQVSGPRAESLQYRIDAETKFINRSKAREWFGWGGWGRNRIRDLEGKDIVASDGLWIILLSMFGLVGLALFYLWWTYPVLVAMRVRPGWVVDPALMVILVCIGLQAVNFLFNAFLDPVLTLLVGSATYQLESLHRRPSRTIATTAFEPGRQVQLSGGVSA